MLEISITFHANVDQIPWLMNFQKIPEIGTKFHDYPGSMWTLIYNQSISEYGNIYNQYLKMRTFIINISKWNLTKMVPHESLQFNTTIRSSLLLEVHVKFYWNQVIIENFRLSGKGGWGVGGGMEGTLWVCTIKILLSAQVFYVWHVYEMGKEGDLVKVPHKSWRKLDRYIGRYIGTLPIKGV